MALIKRRKYGLQLASLINVDIFKVAKASYWRWVKEEGGRHFLRMGISPIYTFPVLKGFWNLKTRCVGSIRGHHFTSHYTQV